MTKWQTALRESRQQILAEAKRLGLEIKTATWTQKHGGHWRVVGPKVEVYAASTADALGQLRTLSEHVALNDAYKMHRAEDAERRRQAAGEALFKSGTFRGEA